MYSAAQIGGSIMMTGWTHCSREGLPRTIETWRKHSPRFLVPKKKGVAGCPKGVPHSGRLPWIVHWETHVEDLLGKNLRLQRWMPNKARWMRPSFTGFFLPWKTLIERSVQGVYQTKHKKRRINLHARYIVNVTTVHHPFQDYKRPWYKLTLDLYFTVLGFRKASVLNTLMHTIEVLDPAHSSTPSP